MFRSAQRLIASQPARRGPRPPRWAAFVIGVGVGAVLMLLLVPRVRQAVSTGWSAEGPSIGPRSFGPAAVTLAPRTINTRVDSPAPAKAVPTADAVPSTPVPVAQPPPIPRPVTARAISNARATRPAAPTPSTLLTRVTTRLKLVGELRGQFDGLLHIEFDLYLAPVRNGGSVDGLVRLSTDEQHVEVRQVTGSWLEHTMTLRETQDTRRGFPEPAIARGFVLEFPTTAEADEITGDWTRTPYHGRLALKSVPLPEPARGVNPKR